MDDTARIARFDLLVEEELMSEILAAYMAHKIRPAAVLTVLRQAGITLPDDVTRYDAAIWLRHHSKEQADAA